jgi:hypothetical protein
MAQSQIATKIATNTFVGGMNKDLDKSVRPSNSYYDAQNIRITADKYGTTGALTNIEGTSLLTEIAASHYICGYCWVRNWLVVFTTTNFNNAPNDEGVSHIYAFPFIGNELQPNDAIKAVGNYEIYDDSDVSEFLNFSVANPIQAVGRYENHDIIKVYWTDGYNNVRWVNIMSTTLATQTVDKFEFISNAIFSKPVIWSIVSGSIDVGMVQYAYQYYIEHGAETLYSPCSNLVHLTVSSDYLATTEDYCGADSLDSNDIYVNSGKGVKIYIQNSNTEYTGIRVVAIHYNMLNAEPTVRLAIDQPITSDSTSITLIDTGESLDTYTYQEFAVIARSLFKADTLNTKDDYLFAGNITDEYFDIGDWDARAYRFFKDGETRYCNLYHDYTDTETPGNNPYIEYVSGGTIGESLWNADSGTNWDDTEFDDLDNVPITDIPEECDCVNPFNDYANDAAIPILYSSTPYKYQFDGETLGGSGYNVEYKFSYDEFILDSDSFQWSAEIGGYIPLIKAGNSGYSYTNFANPGVLNLYVPTDTNVMQPGYMHDETYRFFIVWYDGKFRKSFARWIGDIRTPHYCEEPFINWFGEGDPYVRYINGRNLCIQFTVKNKPEGAEYFQIVRVKKESFGDKNILTQGLLKGTRVEDDIEYQEQFGITDTSMVDSANDYCILASPDINFGSEITYSAGDQLLTIARTVDIGDAPYSDDCYYIDEIYTDPTLAVGKIRPWKVRLDPFTDTFLDIDDIAIISPGDNTYNLSGVSFKSALNSAKDYVSGTALLIDKSNASNIAWRGNNDVAGNAQRFLCNYRRNNWNTMHGGNTYLDRSRNVCIVASDCVSFTLYSGLYLDVYGGDTFINYFDHLSYSADLTLSNNACKAEVLLFPVQSRYNLDLRHDDSYRRKFSIDNFELVQETSGTQVNATNDEYEQLTDYYKYNTVYSQENSAISFFPKPIDALYSLEDNFDCRIRSSDKKSNGERIDSWFLFRTNNYIDVDSAYGSLVSLNVYKDTLMFWQPKGFGVLSVNPRSLIQDESGNSLVLGTGGVLDRYDYISRNVGTSCKFSVAVTDNSVYWVDDSQKEIMQYISGVRGTYNYQSKQDELSKAKGMSSYLKSLDSIVDAISIVDRVNNEILFTITPGSRGVVAVDNISGLYHEILITMDDPLYDDDYSLHEILKINNSSYKVKSTTDYLYIYDYTPNTDPISRDFTVGDVVWVGNNSNTFTLSFGEIINAFGSFYSFTPVMYFDCDNIFLSLETYYKAGINKKLYLHNNGNYGLFYDNAYSDSSVTFHVNQDYAATKVFDNIFWDSKAINPADNDKEIFTITWSKLSLHNDYQNVQYRDTVPNPDVLYDLDLVYKTVDPLVSVMRQLPYDRRERMFTMAVPRNRVRTDTASNPDIFYYPNVTTEDEEGYMDRLRDKYLTAKFTWTNTSYNYKFTCPFISTKYRYSIR